MLDQTKNGYRVLIVDDEEYILDLLDTGLDFVGYETTTAKTGEEAINSILADEPDLILLDITMEDVDGHDVLEYIRHRGYTTPVIFITARDSTEETIEGLNMGADDYITKPFSLKEVVARCEVVLKRSTSKKTVINVGDLAIDTEQYEVTRAGKPIDLSVTEFKLLHFLASRKGKLVTKLDIIDHVWDGKVSDDSTVVESYISYLRKKIDRLGPPLIHTSRGTGYIIREPRDTITA
ncbi:MAG: response regulator transcription factor [Micrococcaceae bacterium]